MVDAGNPTNPDAEIFNIIDGVNIDLVRNLKK